VLAGASDADIGHGSPSKGLPQGDAAA